MSRWQRVLCISVIGVAVPSVAVLAEDICLDLASNATDGTDVGGTTLNETKQARLTSVDYTSPSGMTAFGGIIMHDGSIEMEGAGFCLDLRDFPLRTYNITIVSVFNRSADINIGLNDCALHVDTTGNVVDRGDFDYCAGSYVMKFPAAGTATSAGMEWVAEALIDVPLEFVRFGLNSGSVISICMNGDDRGEMVESTFDFDKSTCASSYVGSQLVPRKE